MATPPAADDVSIRVSCAADAAAPAAGGGKGPPLPQEEGKGERRGDDPPEKQLARFVRSIVLGEWVGDGFGTLALAWATTVILGGFCSSLNRQDFWFATFMIFVESIRIFSRSYKSDSQYLFGSARAIRWISSYFPRMLVKPHVGNELVLVMGLWLNLIHDIDFLSMLPFDLALFLFWTRKPQHPQPWQIRVVAIAYLFFPAYKVIRAVILLIAMSQQGYSNKSENKLSSFLLLYGTLPAIIEAGVVWRLLKLRPPRVVKLTSSTCGRRLVSLAKVISAVWLAADQLAMWYPQWQKPTAPIFLSCLLSLSTPIAMLVLSLGSLQDEKDADAAAADSRFAGRCTKATDAILHIFFLFHLVQPIPIIVFQVLVPDLAYPAAIGLSWAVVLVLLLVGNLQIPTAVAQMVLSSLRLRKLLRQNHIDYSPGVRDSNPNMVAALAVFYLLALCQGSLYIMASFLALLSPFPRRWLMREFKFGGKLGEEAIHLFYENAFESGMEKGVFGSRSSIMNFADFAIKSLSSRSSPRDIQAAGLYVLHKILQLRKTDRSTQDLILRVTSGSDIAVSSTLIGMLSGAADVQKYGCDIRLLAAKVTCELAGSLRIRSFPGMLKTVSLLLSDALVLEAPNQQQRPGLQQKPLACAIGEGGRSTQGSNNGGWSCSWDRWLWHWMKPEYWSVQEEPTLGHQDSVPVLGMKILEELAADLDNCAKILKDNTTDLISKTIGIIGLATIDNEQNDALVSSSLKFLRRLVSTGERIGAELRQVLWNHPFLLTNLARALELENDSSSSRPHQIWEPAVDIIAKLALHKEAGPEIGRIQVITARLMHVFLGRHGPANDTYYDLSLRKVSGEALANLALWSTANCSAILEAEPGYQVINDLKNMLSDKEHIYVAASLLLNLCAHSSVNLLLSHPQASEDLSSVLTTVMQHLKHPMMDDAEGKQLECLVNLASLIGDVNREAFVRVLESQTNSGAELVQNLLCTLNSKKIPNPEYPRMRRVIVKIMIIILKWCDRTVEQLVAKGTMMVELKESLIKIQRTPSRVEDYRVFYDNIGLMLKDGEPMSALVARAKALLDERTTHAEEGKTGDDL